MIIEWKAGVDVRITTHHAVDTEAHGQINFKAPAMCGKVPRFGWKKAEVVIETDKCLKCRNKIKVAEANG